MITFYELFKLVCKFFNVKNQIKIKNVYNNSLGFIKILIGSNELYD